MTLVFAVWLITGIFVLIGSVAPSTANWWDRAWFALVVVTHFILGLIYTWPSPGSALIYGAVIALAVERLIKTRRSITP